jgi:outer membrane protein OmpA-like peptidoglycan-associated protein
MLDYYTNNPYGATNIIYHNSHTIAHDMTIDAVITFGNVRFHKERTKVVFNAFVTGGGFIYQTFYDHFDENGLPYDYRSIPNVNNPNVSKKDVIQALNQLRNGVYETSAEGHPDTKNGSFISNYSFRPVMGAGFGMTFRLNRFMNLDFQTRMMFTRDDLVDGHRWQESDGSTVSIGGAQVQSSRGMTRDFDTYTNTTLGLTFKLVGKKKTESTTLLNPFHYTYAKLAESDPDRILNELAKDTDGDGVPDIFDKEPNTPEGAPVDPAGRALDSDKDGIIDLYDLEPFSPPGYPVNEFGVAQVPPPACCDEMGGGAGAICESISELPSVHFDKDKYYIRPEFYAHMHNIAEMMLLCPDLKVVATGMTDKDDNEKYNEQLSWNRANAVIDYITAKYGVDRSRFIVEFDGKKNASGTSSIDQFRERKVGFRVAKDGETGNSNPPAPHPGLKAGSDK